MRFRYEGFTKSGDVKRGYIDAERIENAAEELRMMGVFSQKLEPDGPDAMRSVLPGGTPLEEKGNKPHDSWPHLNAACFVAVPRAEANVPEAPALEPAKVPKRTPADWQKDLKDNLAIIGKVAKYCDKNDKLFADIPNPEFGKQLAITESVKQALMKAIHDAR
jgi:hypothetical protein